MIQNNEALADGIIWLAVAQGVAVRNEELAAVSDELTAQGIPKIAVAATDADENDRSPTSFSN